MNCCLGTNTDVRGIHTPEVGKGYNLLDGSNLTKLKENVNKLKLRLKMAKA